MQAFTEFYPIFKKEIYSKFRGIAIAFLESDMLANGIKKMMVQTMTDLAPMMKSTVNLYKSYNLYMRRNCDSENCPKPWELAFELPEKCQWSVIWEQYSIYKDQWNNKVTYSSSSNNTKPWDTGYTGPIPDFSKVCPLLATWYKSTGVQMDAVSLKSLMPKNLSEYNFY